MRISHIFYPMAFLAALCTGVASAENLVKEAVCRRDESSFISIKSIIEAGALDRAQVIEDVKSAIRDCVSSGGTARRFLLELAGPSVRIPFWLQAPHYEHGDNGDRYYGAAFLKSGTYDRYLIEVSYPQMVLLQSYGTSNERPEATDSLYAQMVTGLINKRDCLGLPPVFYAATRNNLESFKWVLDRGGDPNMLVPFVTAEPGVASEFISENTISKDINGGGYTLRDQFRCEDMGPSTKMMNAYAQNNELVPVWTYAIKNVDNQTGRANIDRNYGIMKEAFAKVPSVPPRTLADLMDNGQWKIEINKPNDLELIKILVSKGADINAKRRNGSSPGATFIKQGISKDVLAQLLALGAKL